MYIFYVILPIESRAPEVQMQTILFIRFSSIGDIVLCSPLLRALKTQQANSRILFATKKQFAPLLEHNPYIDKLFLLDKDLKTLICELKAEPIDFIADLHNNLRSKCLRWAIGKKSTVLKKYNWQKWLLVHFKLEKMPQNHIVDRYFETLKSLNVSNDNKGLEFYNGISREHSKCLKLAIPQDYAVVVIGGTYFTKRIPLKQLVHAIMALPYTAVLIGSKADETVASELSRITSDMATLHNYCGKTSIAESAELIRHSRLVITGDTGMMHIAAAYQKPILSVWGNTVPTLGFAPYMPEYPNRYIILENNKLPCRPCSKLGHNHCPKQHFECMLSLDIKSAVENILQQTSP